MDGSAQAGGAGGGAGGGIGVAAEFSGVRVMLVEDTAIVAAEVARQLKRLGCEVLGPFTTVERALAVDPSREKIDAALLDVNLAGHEVYPVAEALAARGVPIALMTGYTRDFLPPRFAATPMLEKPFTRLELGSMMHQLVPRRARA